MGIGHYKYRRVAEDLRARIQAGEYPYSSRIPSYSGLAEQYGVSVSTAQRAVSWLRRRNLVTGVPGRGVYVR